MVDVTDATFEQEVMARSMQVPVVIDLWATWCQPCVALGPIIERAVAATNGQVVLAKVDVDANPQVGAAFRVQSIPAVFAMHQQKIVDQFPGAQPGRSSPVRQQAPADQEETEVERLLARRRPPCGPQPSSVDHRGGHLCARRTACAAGETDQARRQRRSRDAEVRRVLAMARTAATLADVEASSVVATGEGHYLHRRYVDLLAVLGSTIPAPLTPAVSHHRLF